MSNSSLTVVRVGTKSQKSSHRRQRGDAHSHLVAYSSEFFPRGLAHSVGCAVDDLFKIVKDPTLLGRVLSAHETEPSLSQSLSLKRVLRLEREKGSFKSFVIGPFILKVRG